MKGQREKAIPVFDPFLMGDNFQRFLKSLDGIVTVYEYLHKIFTLVKPKESFFVLNFMTLLILYYEFALIMSPIAVLIFTFYNFYKKK